jgi:hypothetical protein
MDMTLPADAATVDKLKLMSLKKEVMSSVLSAGVRVNDSALRKKDDDKVAKMLRLVKDKSADSVGQPAAEEVTVSDLFG